MVISPFWGSLWSLILCFLGQDYASASLRLRIVSSTWKKNRYILHSLNSALGCWENPVLRKPYRSQLKPMHWNNDLYFVSTLSVYDNINIMLYFAVSWKFKDQISQNWHSISKCKMLESKQARFHCTDLSKEQPHLTPPLLAIDSQCLWNSRVEPSGGPTKEAKKASQGLEHTFPLGGSSHPLGAGLCIFCQPPKSLYWRWLPSGGICEPLQEGSRGHMWRALDEGPLAT